MASENSPVISGYVIQPPPPPRMAPIYINKGKGEGLTAVFTEYDADLAIWANELLVAQSKKKEDDAGTGGRLMTPAERKAEKNGGSPIGAWITRNDFGEVQTSGSAGNFGEISIIPMEFRLVPYGSIILSSPGFFNAQSIWTPPTSISAPSGYLIGPPRTILIRYRFLALYPISVFLTPGYDVPISSGGFIPRVATSCRLVTRRVTQTDLLCWLESADTPPVPLTEIHIGSIQVTALTPISS